MPKICLTENNLLQLYEKKNANTFKPFYSNLAADLLNQLPAVKSIFDMNSVKKYYSVLNTSSDSLKLQLMNKEEVFKILFNIDPKKAYDLDEIPCRMLKDGAEIIIKHLSQIVNMSLGSKLTVKVRYIFKKITDLFHFCL